MTLISTADLVLDALNKAGEKSDGTSTFTERCLGYIDILHKKFLAGGNEFNVDLAEPWTWAKTPYPGVIILKPGYNTGYVSLTNGSNQGTFSTPPTFSASSMWLKMNDRPEFYLVTAHVAGQAAFTIDSVYADTTGAALPFFMIQLDYSLGTNILRQINSMNVYRVQFQDSNPLYKIVACDFRSFSQNYPFSRMQPGVPTHFCPIASSPGNIIVRFNKFVAEQTRVEFDYIPIPVDLTNVGTSIPLIPFESREVLSYAAAYKLCVDKSDNRAKEYETKAKEMILALINANRKTVTQQTPLAGQLIPRQDQIYANNWPTAGNT